MDPEMGSNAIFSMQVENDKMYNFGEEKTIRKVTDGHRKQGKAFTKLLSEKET